MPIRVPRIVKLQQETHTTPDEHANPRHTEQGTDSAVNPGDMRRQSRPLSCPSVTHVILKYQELVQRLYKIWLKRVKNKAHKNFSQTTMR